MGKEEYAVSTIEVGIEDDDKELLALGYQNSFRREFTSIPTISFAFSITAVCAGVATTFDTPLTLGGPSAVVWDWFIGTIMCFILAVSVAEIISAYPTCGGLYTASAYLTPKKHRAKVGWLVGWLSIIGQIAAISSGDFGLSNMIWAAVYVAKDGQVEITETKIVALFIALVIIHGLLNSLPTKHLAVLTSSFVFVNIGATMIIVIVLLALTPRHEMHPAGYVFGPAGFLNQTGGWNSALAFLFGIVSVDWTMTGYDATAHISEEVKRAAYAAPSATIMAVVGTGIIGWVFNIVLVLCSGPLENLPGDSGSAVLEIMNLRIGKVGTLFLWSFVCATSFCNVLSSLQSCSRTLFAFSRDNGLPDRGFFGKVSDSTRTPLRAVWLATFASIPTGLLDLASPIAADAIFSMTSMASDLSYIIPIVMRRLYQNHPEVVFKPGPFYLGDGLLGWACNITCTVWVLFISVVFALPNVLPVTWQNMNYSSVITAMVVILAFIWYILAAHRHYDGPRSANLEPKRIDSRHSDEKVVV